MFYNNEGVIISYHVYIQRLSKTELEQLDDWYQLINPSRSDSEE